MVEKQPRTSSSKERLRNLQWTLGIHGESNINGNTEDILLNNC
ncbi:MULTISPECIES: hypothetical protein [Oscillatoriales]|nr:MULTISPECIES: hypothetical protein [Oscillatoriales]